MDEDLPFQFRNTRDGTYDVYLFDVYLGGVRRELGAWSYGRWFVDGDRVESSTGAYTIGPARGDRHRAPLKPHGYPTREGAAHRLAVAQSGVIMAAVNARSELGAEAR